MGADARKFFERRVGLDFGDVRVHTGVSAAQRAAAVHAAAYTVGRDIVFAHDRFRPDTAEGRRLIAHELGHVLQQRDAPDAGEAGLTVTRPEDGEERAADRFASQVMSGTGAEAAAAVALVQGARTRRQIAREAIEQCSTSNRETIGEAVTRAFAETSRVLGLMSTIPPTEPVRDALYLAFRSDSVGTAQLVAANLRVIRDSMIGATYQCVNAGSREHAASCTGRIYGFVDGVGERIHGPSQNPIFLCMPQFLNLGHTGQSRGIVHEVAHRYLSVLDTGYFTMPDCDETPRAAGPVFVEDKDSGTEGDNPHTRLNNADAYACFVHYLVNTRPALRREHATAFRGANLDLVSETSGLSGHDIYTQTSTPSDPTFVVRGAPLNSGFRFRWRFEVGATRYRMESPSGRDPGAFDEGNSRAFVPQGVRALLGGQPSRTGVVTCEIELYRPLGAYFSPPVVVRRVAVTIIVGQDPADPAVLFGGSL